MGSPDIICVSSDDELDIVAPSRRLEEDISRTDPGVYVEVLAIF